MSIVSRVKELIDKEMMTQKEFASKLGISQPRLNNYLTGLRDFPKAILIDIAKITNCELAWLMTGASEQLSYDVRTRDGVPHLVSIPVVADIAAGTGIEAEDLEPQEVISISQETLSLPGPYIAFRVDGKSMEPELRTGDIAIISQSWNNFNYNGRICAFRSSDGLLIKRVYIAPKAKFGLLIPVNPAHPIIKYDREDQDIYLLGILVATIRKYN